MRLSLCGTVVAVLSQGALVIILARMLTPADYGWLAAALVVVMPTTQLLLSPLERAMLLQSELSRSDARATMWAMSAMGGLATCVLMLFAALAPFPSELRRVISGLAPTLMIASVGVSPRVLLRRELAFGRLAITDALSVLLGMGCVAVIAAAHGYGVASLVAGYLGQAGVQTACYICFARLAPGRPLRGAPPRPVVFDALRIARFSVLEIVQVQIPSAFVGGFLGSAVLGQFDRAHALGRQFPEMLTMSASRVLFTSFALVRADVAKLRSGSRTMIEIAAAVTLPLCFGIAAAAPDLVTVLLGSKWRVAGTMVPLLAVGTAADMMALLLAIMNEAIGKLREKFILQAITTAATALAFLLAVHVGPQACAAAYTAGALIFLIGQLILSGAALKTTLLQLLGWLVPGALCGLVAAGCVLLTRSFLGDLQPQMRLALEVSECGAVLVLFYLAFFPALLAETMRLSGAPRWLKLPRLKLEVN